jgi:hypothetical protein
MPASRVAVTSAGVSTIASAPSSTEGRAEVQIVNRGPNSVYIDDVNTVTAAAGFEVKSGEGFHKALGRKEALFGRCAASETATVHVFRDDID